MVKKCIVVSATDQRRVGTMPLVPPFFVPQDLSAQELLNLFQSHKRHFAIVCRDSQQAMDAHHRGEPLSPGHVLG